MSRLILRSAAFISLICSLTVSVAAAAPARGEIQAGREQAGIAEFFRVALPELWTSLTGSSFTKEGSSLDPSGLEKSGSSLDPFGHPAQDAGSSLDPSGGTHG